MAPTVTEDAKEAVDEGREKLTGGNGDLGKKLLIPAAAGLGTLVATYAARKAPELFRDRLQPKLEHKGGEEIASVGKKAAEQLKDRGGAMGKLADMAGGGDGGGKKTRRLPIQRWTDVAVPIDVAYDKWTQFEEYPKFMHRVLSVEKTDRNKLSWDEKIWFSKRHWEGEITQRRKNERISWKTTKGMKHKGVVTFHKLDTNLTRVMVDMDFEPTGMIEKMGSGMRFVKRAVQADLARFKAYVELNEAKGLDYGQDDDSNGDASSKS
jgi:Polyketide cyclase / dehydrase and lipid transport